MIFIQHKFDIMTMGRSIVNITDHISQFLETMKISIGLCHIFLHHTSASLILCENADPLVQQDLEAFMHRLVPDGDILYQHIDEGPDDMPSHVRATLTSSFLTLPITKGKLALGTWQGIYLWEHRLQAHQRFITVTLQGE